MYGKSAMTCFKYQVYLYGLSATLVVKVPNFALFYCSTRVIDPDPVGSSTSSLDLALYFSHSQLHKKMQTHFLKRI
jgi:hypothetical protein